MDETRETQMEQLNGQIEAQKQITDKHKKQWTKTCAISAQLGFKSHIIERNLPICDNLRSAYLEQYNALENLKAKKTVMTETETENIQIKQQECHTKAIKKKWENECMTFDYNEEHDWWIDDIEINTPYCVGLRNLWQKHYAKFTRTAEETK